MSATQLLHLLT